MVALEKEIETAGIAGAEPPDLELLARDAMPLQLYNCQLAVDSDHLVIVAVAVRNQSPDSEHLEPVLERIATNAGALPVVMTMNAGYWSENNVNACSDQGVDPYIATSRLPHGHKLQPKRGPMNRDADAKSC